MLVSGEGCSSVLILLEIIQHRGKPDDAGSREGTFRSNVLQVQREHKDLLSDKNRTVNISLTATGEQVKYRGKYAGRLAHLVVGREIVEILFFFFFSS